MAQQRLVHVHFSKMPFTKDGEGEIFARPKVNCPLGCEGPVFLDNFLIGDLRHGEFLILEQPHPFRNGRNKGSRPSGYCHECGVQITLCGDTEPAIVEQAKEWGTQYKAAYSERRRVAFHP
jgi:hypothetical protein